MATLNDLGPWAVIGGLYGVSALATVVVPPAALVVLMAPIALSASADPGISPQSVVIAVAIAAAASFMSTTTPATGRSRAGQAPVNPAHGTDRGSS